MFIGIGIDLCGGQQAFSPLTLFAAGEQGGWWDPSDFSTMFQDSAGTTPVTAVTQPVGLIRDKSGRGNHASQATAASRPTLQQDASGFFYLSFDGVDDSLSTASITLNTTDKMTWVVGVFKTTDASTQMIAELSISAGTVNPGTINMSANTAPEYRSGGTGSSAGASTAAVIGTTFTAPIANVVSVAVDWAQATVATEFTLHVNGATPSIATAGVQSGGNFSNQPLFIGGRAGTSLFFNGRLYGFIMRAALTAAAQLAQAERYVGSKMGVAF